MPVWSVEILDEVRRNQVGKFNWDDDLADYWRREVEDAFPSASEDRYQPYVDRCANDVKDRHVLAAGISSQADSIVTFNLKHFPKAALEPWGIEAITPSTFLLSLYELRPAVVVSKIDDMSADRYRDRMGTLVALHRTVPGFALTVAADLSLELVIS